MNPDSEWVFAFLGDVTVDLIDHPSLLAFVLSLGHDFDVEGVDFKNAVVVLLRLRWQGFASTGETVKVVSFGQDLNFGTLL